MLKMKFDVETMKNLTEVVKPLSKSECVAIDFGTGVVKDKMLNKVTIATGTEQLETAFLSAFPTESDDSPEKSTINNPLKRVIVSVKDLLGIIEGLLVYETEIGISVEDTRMILSVDEKAQMPVGFLDETVMKAVIPHQENSCEKELFDPTMMYCRVHTKTFMSAIKKITMLQSEFDDDTQFYVICIKDCKPVMAEKAGKKYVSKNADIEFISGNDNVINCEEIPAICKKMDNVIYYVDETAADGKPVKAERKQDFETFKKAVCESKNLPVNKDRFLFAIPASAMNILAKIASFGGAYLDFTIGQKFLMAASGKVIYTCAQESIVNRAFFDVFHGQWNEMHKKGSVVTVSGSELQKALKLFAIYEADIYKKRLPLEITIADRLLIDKSDAHAALELLETSGSEKNNSFGLYIKFFSLIVNALGTGNLSIYHTDNPKAPILIAPANATSENGTIVCKIDVSMAKAAIEAQIAKDIEKEKKKGK